MAARIASILKSVARWPASLRRGQLTALHRDRETDFSGVSVQGMFEAVVETTPRRPALSGTSWCPDYRTLNHAANHVAQQALACSLPTATPVAVLMAHDSPQVAAVLGVLKSGHIATVLNAGDPPARLAQLIEDAQAQIIVCDPQRRELAEALRLPHQHVLVAEPERCSSPCPNPSPPAAPNAVAFLVYTSGSTGRPKAVMQTHSGVVHNAWRLALGMKLTRGDKLVLLASLSGGQGLGTTFTALLNGATLCPYPIMEKGTTGLADWMRNEATTIFVSSASAFRHFLRSQAGLPRTSLFPSVRLVRLASEHATSDDRCLFARFFKPSCRLLTTYSSSETGNLTQGDAAHGMEAEHERLPVGSPAAGIHLSLIREDGQPASPGEPGEIHVSGRHFAAGYWRSPELTARHFSPDPHRPGFIRFRSGDTGTLNAAGRLVIGPRQDQTVKIRGFRVHLTEVEDAIKALSTVADAKALARELPDGGRQLVAAIIVKRGARMETAQLRQDLGTTQPSHMIPTGCVFLDEFPLTPHGKVDHAALLELAAEARPCGSGGPPQDEAEKRLATIWEGALSVSSLGREDDFFELGGDSLTGAVIAAQVHHAFGVSLDLQAFHATPNIAAMASTLVACTGEAQADADPGPQAGEGDRSGALSFVEERTWQISQSSQGTMGYTVMVTHSISGPLDVSLLQQSIDLVVDRHEILRTAYPHSAQGPQACVIPSLSPEFVQRSVPAGSSTAEALASLQSQLSSDIFDLAQGPLVRFGLLRVSATQHLLVRCNHHIISDGISWRIFFQDVGVIYTALKKGHPPALDPLPFQYRDYAAWQRQRLDPARNLYPSQFSWWQKEIGGVSNPVAFPVKPPQHHGETSLAPSAGVHRWGLEARTSRRLDRLAQQGGTTFFVVRLAAYAARLALGTGQRDFVMGTYAGNRQSAGNPALFGFFSNLITLRFRFAPELSFREWMRQVGNLVTAAVARGDIPYATLLEELHRAGTPPPEIRAIFSVNGRMPPSRFSDLEISDTGRSWNVMPWGCSLSFSRWREGDDCLLLFDAGLYDRAGMLEFLDHYLQFMEAVSLSPDVPMQDLVEAACATSHS